VNYARIALAFLGATVAYFGCGFVMFGALPGMKSEFMKYPNVYRSQDGMMKVMPYGVVAILISIVVVAVLYARIYPAGSGIASGVYLGALIGIFSVCTFVIHNYVDLNVGPRSRSTRASATSFSGSSSAQASASSTSHLRPCH
jgi:archaellum biogenesis protein FlaJ (TadC family)